MNGFKEIRVFGCKNYFIDVITLDIKKYADTVQNDAYGTAWATLKGQSSKAPTVMLEAHADEIGYIIKHICKNGFLQRNYRNFCRLGPICNN